MPTTIAVSPTDPNDLGSFALLLSALTPERIAAHNATFSTTCPSCGGEGCQMCAGHRVTP